MRTRGIHSLVRFAGTSTDDVAKRGIGAVGAAADLVLSALPAGVVVSLGDDEVDWWTHGQVPRNGVEVLQHIGVHRHGETLVEADVQIG